MKTLKERLAYAMSATGKDNQTELSRESGVSQSAISKILRGVNETSKHSGKLAAALGVSADWLINGSGSAFGGDGDTIQRVDVSKLVNVYDENGPTGEQLSWFSRVPESFRAYILKNKTGISQVPANSIVIVDPESAPGQNALVLVNVKNSVSAFRYHIGGDGTGFLSVDDDRIPLTPVAEGSIVGTIVQIFIPELNT
ncbi:helix-turn-helix domain-containing protein [Enterobacter asburiae]|uniref:helix-turn-helix domain-containing protein n=1 Tax=Enterobacter asburiae TaxID=61645 RepID=UPI003CE8823F